jgi:hypothetical protein
MLKGFLVITICMGLLQGSPAPKVNRVSASTPFDASIIFEYAHRLLPEDEPLKSVAVEEFVTQLKATGLFRDVEVTLVPTRDGQKVDVNVTPTWDPQRDRFILNEIVFEGPTGIREAELREFLKQHGIMPNALLLKHPLQRIKSLMREAVRETYQGDPDQMYDLIEHLQDGSIVIRIEQVGAQRFNLVVHVPSYVVTDFIHISANFEESLRGSTRSFQSKMRWTLACLTGTNVGSTPKTSRMWSAVSTSAAVPVAAT